MVRCIAFIFSFVLFFPCAFSAPTDSFLGTSDPAYIQILAPRFVRWVYQNHELVSTAERESWKKILLDESAQMSDWSFTPWENQMWPRLQFSLSFFKGKEKDAVLFVLPQNKMKSLKAIRKLLKFPADLEKTWIGFGFSLRSSDIFIFSLEADKNFIAKIQKISPEISGSTLIKRSIFRKGQIVGVQYLTSIKAPQKSTLAFASLVNTWRAWYSLDGHFISYDLGLDKFNFQFLDGAAVAAARKVNQEFLLEKWRITYRANDDYDVLYP